MSVCGVELCNFNDKKIESLYTAWRKVIRRIFRLPSRTHNYIVHNSIENIVVKLDRRLAKFIYSMFNSEVCELFMSTSII